MSSTQPSITKRRSKPNPHSAANRLAAPLPAGSDAEATPPASLQAAWACLEAVAARGLARSAAAQARARGLALYELFVQRGYWPMTPTAALAEGDLAVVCFYRRLAEDPPRLGTVDAPSWMRTADFAFVNIRACSPDPARTGRITDALKLLPVMRVSAIHLAPFFDCCLDNLYAIDSVRTVTDGVLDPALSAAGVAGDDQIRLLIDGIHTLGWRVGFDLEPHTANFSRIVLEHPHCFRWLELDATKAGLAGGLTQEAMLEPAAQEAIVAKVRALVATELRASGLAAIEDTSQGLEAMRACHQTIIRRCIERGYWTVPSHTWGGVGLPAFSHYDTEGCYPEYTYLDRQGQDHREHAFGTLSPFGFYHGLPLNRVPDPSRGEVPVRNQAAIDLMASLFPQVRDRYGFDFVRLDYVDHVFDSVADGQADAPISDRVTPAILEEVLTTARAGRSDIAAMAERMGSDVEAYGGIGFNLLLGTDMLSSIHPGFMGYVFDLQRRLEAAPTEHARCSVLAAIDSHDSGHPLFWTTPLSQVVGPDGLALRHFVARFATCGPRRRPKYEVMGNQDLSWGLYEANNRSQGLTWVGDEAFNQRYHALEDLYHQIAERLAVSRLGVAHADPEGWAAWFLDSDDPGARLLCVIACEPELEGGVKTWATQPPALVPVGPVHIDVTLGSRITQPVVLEIPLNGTAPFTRQLQGPMLTLRSLAPQSCHLFSILQGG
jgi:hypothetical protein